VHLRVGPIHKNKWFHLVVGLIVTAVCFWWAVRDVDWQEVGQQFSKARYETIPLYILFLVLFFVLKAIRWAWLLRPLKKLTARVVAAPLMIGFMGNNILPAHLGEIFRVVILSRQQKVPAAGVLSSVAIERVLDVVAVLILVGVGLMAVRDLPDMIRNALFVGGLIAIGGVVAFALAIVWMNRSVTFAIWMVGHVPLPVTIQEKLIETITSAAAGASVLRDGRLLALILSNSLMQWSCNCAMIAVSLWSFGIEVPFSATLILLGVLVVAVTIPTSPGFFGAIQVAFVETLKMFDVPESSAFAASIYYHLIQYIVVTAVGFGFLGQTGISLSKLEDEAEHLQDEVDPVDLGTDAELSEDVDPEKSMS